MTKLYPYDESEINHSNTVSLASIDPSASSRLRIGVADLGACWEASDDKEVSHAQEVRCTALG